MDRTPIRQLARDDYLTVTPDTDVGRIVEMFRSGTHGVVIVVEDEAPAGIITNRDLVQVFADALSGLTTDLPTAGDVMTSPVHTVSDSAEVGEVVDLMAQRGLRLVPLVDEHGNLAGVARFTDVMSFHAQMLKFERSKLTYAVEERTRELQAATERLKVLSGMDGLMRIGNRRAMDDAVGEAHALARRHGRPYCVVLVDIDHFKQYNDRYGHPTADGVLRSVAACLKQVLRSSDKVFRYGGEEILALLPETGGVGGIIAAERMRASVQALDIEHLDSATGVVTASLGVAMSGTDPELMPDRAEDVINEADAGLYLAKDAGRNRIGMTAIDRITVDLASIQVPLVLPDEQRMPDPTG